MYDRNTNRHDRNKNRHKSRNVFRYDKKISEVMKDFTKLFLL